MKTNYELEQEALDTVSAEYVAALAQDASFLVLLEIKGRLELIKAIYTDDRIQMLLDRRSAA